MTSRAQGDLFQIVEENRLPKAPRQASAFAAKAVDCYRRAYEARTPARKRILLNRLQGMLRDMEPKDRASYYAGIRKLNV